MQLQNVARYFLPHLLALSTSSPFWMGRNTGFKSYRSLDLLQLPAHRYPGPRSSSRAEFERYVDLLIKTGCIDNGKKIWWDVRPTPVFGTLEFRVCDIATRVDDAIAMAAPDPGLHRQVLLAVREEHDLPGLPARADQREQVARRCARASTAS